MVDDEAESVQFTLVSNVIFAPMSHNYCPQKCRSLNCHSTRQMFLQFCRDSFRVKSFNLVVHKKCQDQIVFHESFQEGNRNIWQNFYVIETIFWRVNSSLSQVFVTPCTLFALPVRLPDDAFLNFSLLNKYFNRDFHKQII